jgi:hypothetical protein
MVPSFSWLLLVRAGRGPRFGRCARRCRGRALAARLRRTGS